MRLLNHSKRDKWKIVSWGFYGVKLVEVSLPPSWAHLDEAFDTLLVSFAQGNPICVLSQYIDPYLKKKLDRKGYPEGKDASVIGFSFVRSLGDTRIPSVKDDDCFMFIKGTSDYDWIVKYRDYNSTKKLPFIVYGLQEIEDDWPNTIAKWDELFRGWYFREHSGKEIAELMNKISFLAWISDSDLCFLVRDSGKIEILSLVENCASEKGLDIEIRDREDESYD